MANYILDRLREDSRHTASLSQIDGQVGHPGVKGRFRELLLNNLLAPWLPVAVGTGTGIIVDHEQRVFDAGQDDIIIFDQMLSPAVLASTNSTHGVYLYDNVLCRVEVKSTLTKADLTSFAQSSKKISELKLATRHPDQSPDVFGTLNFLAAFDTQVALGQELTYLCDAIAAEGVDPTGGIVSMLCIANRGLWLVAVKDDGTRAWKKLRMSPNDPLAYFVGIVSNSCFDQRAARMGVKQLGGGIGLYLDHPFDWV